MWTGTQFTGTVAPSSSQRWFTHSWPPGWHVAWYVVPVTPIIGGPEIEWSVEVERATATAITYWITVRNLKSVPVSIEARFAVLN